MFQRQLSNRLLAWSAPGIILGSILTHLGDSFWRGFGIQTAAWSAIDGLIALVGRRSAKQHAAAPDRAHVARTLRRVLIANTALDVLYVLLGLRLARRGKRQIDWRGHGWGIVLQGAFLFIFDLLHARALAPTLPSR